MKKWFTTDNLLHALAAAVGTWASWYFLIKEPTIAHYVLSPILVAIAFAAFGTAREAWQHKDDVPIMTMHRWREALSWPIGSLFGSAVAVLASLL